MTTMIRETRSGGYSAWAWILQAASGALLVVLLSLHLIAQHFMAPGGVLEYNEVVAHLRNPIIFVLETAFAGSVLFHAFAGVRAILLDLGLSKTQERPINITLTVLGVGLFVYGLILTLATVTR
jgi:succinate dehydrogenase cytochrome b556 subunit